jgi:hypothetical protein
MSGNHQEVPLVGMTTRDANGDVELMWKGLVVNQF